MTKQTTKKMTLIDLIKDKEKYKVKKNTTADLLVNRMGASITILKADRPLCLETIGMSRDPEQEDMADIHMVYNAVIEPNLKDPELQKEYECVEPYDIVSEIFEPGEIASISGECLEFAGYGDSVKRVEDLKN